MATVYFLERPIDDLDWVVYLLVFTMLLIVVGRLLFSNNYESLTSLNRFQEINDNQALFGVVFQLCFAVLAGALMVGLFGSDYDYIFYTPALKTLGIALLILLFFGFRSVFGLVFTYALGISQDRNYNLKTTNYFRAYSVGVLWVGALLFYFSDLPGLVVLIILLLVLIIIRGLNYTYIFKNQPAKQSKNLYYNILYLCALEILPLLVLFKFLNMW